jgi:hypothetical protein
MASQCCLKLLIKANGLTSSQTRGSLLRVPLVLTSAHSDSSHAMAIWTYAGFERRREHAASLIVSPLLFLPSDPSFSFRMSARGGGRGGQDGEDGLVLAVEKRGGAAAAEGRA